MTPRNAEARVAAGSDGDTGQQRQPKDTRPEAPEHHGDRNRFLMWSLMCGFIEPKRVVERIVAEVENEATRCVAAQA